MNSIVNSKTILEMAHEAGLGDAEGWINEEYEYKKEILAFAALVRADEREACAKQLDFNAQATSNGGDEYLAAALWQEAEEIRARGNT